MPCYKPLTAYQSHLEKTFSGKTKIYFDEYSADQGPGTFEEMRLPCGQCLGCRMDRSKQWALRCWHEASLYTNNCFITLTFDDGHLNDRKSLVRSDFPKFMKRLRKAYKGMEYVKPVSGVSNDYPIRFFHCGEYGDKMSRPHHHACLFNFDFTDKEEWQTKKGVTLYRSPSLEKLWPDGFSTIGEVTFESAAYVARYITKKVNGQNAAAHYYRLDENGVNPDTGECGEPYYLEPEYVTMSMRPGIAGGWFKKQPGDIFPKDYATVGGRKFKTPRYYDKLYERYDSAAMADIKTKRKACALLAKPDNTVERLRAKSDVAFARNKRLVREYENGA